MKLLKEIFLRIEPSPPTVTHQQKKVAVIHGKPVTYEEPRLKNARALFMSLLAPHKPDKPYHCPMMVKYAWFFPRPKSAKGEWKTTKPDCTNITKLLEDCLTASGFWKDDALCAVTQCSKVWNPKTAPHGILITIHDLTQEEYE